MANSSLAKKLLIKPGQRVVVINSPPGYVEGLELPEGVELAEKLSGAFDFVQVFARNVAELNRHAPKALRAVKSGGVLWVSYPKGSSKMQTDLTRDAGWEIIHEAGLEGVAQVSIDETWSAGRFRPLAEVKRKAK